MRIKEILRKLALYKGIKEKLRVEEVFAKVFHYLVRSVRGNPKPELQQRFRAVEHRLIGHLRRLRDIAGFQLQLGFENFALAGYEFEIDGEDDFSGAFSDTD